MRSRQFCLQRNAYVQKSDSRLAAHHPLVGSTDTLKRVFFDHHPHAGECGEGERFLGIDGRARILPCDDAVADPALSRQALGLHKAGKYHGCGNRGTGKHWKKL
jgi:hypothetical protein